MLTANNIRISRILKDTWQVDLVMVATCCVVYAFHFFLLRHHFDIPAIVPTVLGTAIAFFIGFNNNQAYGRWWEARGIWGRLVNDSRSWARDVLIYVSSDKISEAELKIIQQEMIYRHIAFLYQLKCNLRGDTSVVTTYISEAEQEEIGRQTNHHNALLEIQSRQLQYIYKQGLIDGYQFLQMDSLLVGFCDEMGMCERIKNTVFPTTYNYLTKVFIWLFVIALELVTVQSMGAWSIFMSWLLGFVFVSTQINGMNLVNPFENKASGVPINQITRTIEINLLQMMGVKDTPPPITPVNDEYVL